MSRQSSVNLAALGAWLAIQALVLLAAAGRWPLSARTIQPAEGIALHELAVLQIVMGALLFPLLMSNRSTALATVAVAWPFLALAGFLAATPPERIALTGAYVTVWLAGLGLWRCAIRSSREQLLGMAIAALLTLGGAAAWYLGAEFAGGPARWSHAGALSVILGVIQVIDAGPAARAAWSIPVAAFVAGLAAVVVRRMQED